MVFIGECYCFTIVTLDATLGNSWSGNISANILSCFPGIIHLVFCVHVESIGILHKEFADNSGYTLRLWKVFLQLGQQIVLSLFAKLGIGYETDISPVGITIQTTFCHEDMHKGVEAQISAKGMHYSDYACCSIMDVFHHYLGSHV
jgi:hypothetical protein